MKPAIAVTGATGFVGTHLVPSLAAAGYQVIAVARSVVITDPFCIDYDQFTPEYIRQNNIRVVVHLAGKAHDLKNTSADKEYYEGNTLLTQKIFDVFAASQARQFFFMSSVKAAADRVAGELTELADPKPATAYGRSKLEAETYILGKGAGNQQQIYILRPCMIHGPENKGNLNLLYKFVQKGFPWPLAAYHNKRSFLSVENLCFTISRFIDSGNITSGIYNVADSGSLSTNELIRILSSVIGRKVFLMKVPRPLVAALAALGTALHLPFNRAMLQKLTENYLVSNRKLLDALGEALPVPVAKGITVTAGSFAKSKKKQQV